MLQWMGGSRRKVTTSRNSTQKRQKQYFEQRKRQQQQLETTGSESFSNGMNACNQHQSNNRSLDVLSLLNLSTVVQHHKSRCHSEAIENPKGDAMTENYDIPTRSLTIRSNKVTPGEPIEFTETKHSSGCQVETVRPQKVFPRAPDSPNRELIRNDKTDHSKTSDDRPLSVFDLLGDDGANDYLEGNLVHEAHVAFAIEGLGKVETKTPVHSPQQPISSYLPLKAQSSKNLNTVLYDLGLEMGDVMEDFDLPLSGSLELPFCGRGIANSFSKQRQKLSSAKECSRLNVIASKFQNSFADDEIFHTNEGKKDEIQNAMSNFVDGNFLDDDHDMTWKNRPRDGSSVDYWDLGNHEMSDFGFEDPYLRNIRSTEKATGIFNIPASPAPYAKQQRSKNDYDFIMPDGNWYPSVGRPCDVREVPNQPVWSCHATEDAGESLSLLSEESCSSSAVRGKSSKGSPPTSVSRQSMRRHDNDIRSPVNITSVEVKHEEDGNHAKMDTFNKRKKTNRSGKFTKMCNPSSPNAGHFLNPTYPKNLGREDSVLFDEGHISSSDKDPGISSFFRNSGANKRVYSSPKLWTEDSFGAYSLPELHSNFRSSFDRSKQDVPPDFLPSGSFSSEELAFCQPTSHLHSCETPFFSTIGSGPSKPDLCMGSIVEGRPRDSFTVAGSQGGAEFLHVSMEGSVVKDGENRSEIQPTDCVQFENNNCIGSNDLSYENGQPVETSGSKNNCSDCDEGEDSAPEMENLKATGSLEHAEEISSSVKMPDKFEGRTDELKYPKDAQISLPCQDRNIEIQDYGLKERMLESKEPNTSLGQSCQVMMLESYVLQLLCVQKVLKETTGRSTVKKV